MAAAISAWARIVASSITGTAAAVTVGVGDWPNTSVGASASKSEASTLAVAAAVAAVMLGVFWLSMSFMTSTLVSFFTDTIIPQIAGG